MQALSLCTLISIVIFWVLLCQHMIWGSNGPSLLMEIRQVDTAGLQGQQMFTDRLLTETIMSIWPTCQAKHPDIATYQMNPWCQGFPSAVGSNHLQCDHLTFSCPAVSHNTEHFTSARMRISTHSLISRSYVSHHESHTIPFNVWKNWRQSQILLPTYLWWSSMSGQLGYP